MSRRYTVDELAETAGVTREMMLCRIATVLSNRPWYQRLWFYIRVALHKRGVGNERS